MSNSSAADFTANPAPLGLCGFGMTTILLNIHNADFVPLDNTVVAMGIFYGGIAQVIAGIMEWKKGNTFGTTAFTSYGFFWLTLVAIWFLPAIGTVSTPSPLSMGCYLAMWGLFTAGLYIGTLKSPRSLQVVFASLTILFALLALANFSGSHMVHLLAGYVGIFCGVSAFYAAMGQVINEAFKRQVMPL